MQKFSLHTHTSGFDGRNSEEEMLAKASELGWTHIGFSNHFIVHANVENSPMYKYALQGGYQSIYSKTFAEAIEKFSRHYKKIDELQQKTDIKILKGMEVDFFSSTEWNKGFHEALAILQPDYLIGSAHFVEHKDILYNSYDIKSAPALEQKQLLHRYWQNERAAAQSGLFTFLSHLDLLKKVGLGQEDEWIEEEQKTVEIIKKYNGRVELNTSHFMFGNEPYPSPRIMRMLAAAGIPVLISDDAHAAAQLENHFEQTERIAKECGIKTLWNPFEKHMNLSPLNLYTRQNS